MRGGKWRVLGVRAHFSADSIQEYGHVMGYSRDEPPRGC